MRKLIPENSCIRVKSGNDSFECNLWSGPQPYFWSILRAESTAQNRLKYWLRTLSLKIVLELASNNQHFNITYVMWDRSNLGKRELYETVKL